MSGCFYFGINRYLIISHPSPTKKCKEDVHNSQMYTEIYAADPLLHLSLVAFELSTADQIRLSF